MIKTSIYNHHSTSYKHYNDYTRIWYNGTRTRYPRPLVPLGGVCSNDQFIFDVAVSATLTTREEVHGIRVKGSLLHIGGKMVFLLSNCVVCFDKPNPTGNRSVPRAF